MAADTDLETKLLECLYAQELSDLAEEGLVFLMRGKTGEAYFVCDLVRGGRVHPIIVENKAKCPALYAAASALQAAGVEQSRIQVYWGKGKTTIHYDAPFDAVRVLIKLAGRIVFYDGHGVSAPEIDSVGSGDARRASTLCGDSKTFALGRTFKGAPAENGTYHSSEPPPSKMLSTSIISKMPSGTNAKNATMTTLNVLANLIEHGKSLTLRPDFRTPGRATKTYESKQKGWLQSLESWKSSGWNIRPTMIYADGQKTKVYQITLVL